MTYKCERCGYSSPLKTNLKRHLSKQKQCRTISCSKTSVELLNELEHNVMTDKQNLCPCGKMYKHKHHLHRHQKTCIAYIIKQKELDEMRQMIELLKNEIKQPRSNHSITSIGDHNTINIHNIVNNNTIVVNNFGNEDTSYLTSDFIEKCTCYLSIGIKSMVKAIYLNKNHPENHTIKVTNIKSPFISVIENQKWVLKNKTEVLNLSVDKIAFILKSYFEEYKDEIKQKYNSYKLNMIEMYHERLENQDDKAQLKKVMTDVFLMFVNDTQIHPRQKNKRIKILNDSV